MPLVLIGGIHNTSVLFKSFFFFQANCGAKELHRKNRLSDEILVQSFNFRHGEDLSIANLDTRGAAKEKLLAYSMFFMSV